MSEMSVLVWLLVAAPDPAEAVQAVDRHYAALFCRLAARAAAEGSPASAAGLFERAVELDGEQFEARKALGYRRALSGKWERTAPPATAADADPARTAVWKKERQALEEARVADIAQACEKSGDAAKTRGILLPLLEKFPRSEAVHRALGHESIGGQYVRPELKATVAAMPLRLRAWQVCRSARAEVSLEGEPPFVVGLDPPVVLYRAKGRRRIAMRYPRERAEAIAAETEAAHALLTHLFGPEAYQWEPKLLYLLDEVAYARLLEERVSDPEERALDARYLAYYDDRVVAFLAEDTEASGRYAHGVGLLTLMASASPTREGGQTQADREMFAWFKEGLAILLSVELFDQAKTFTASLDESMAKVRDAPPEGRTRESCLAHVRERLLEGGAYPLAEICARSLNGLDALASVEAYSFVRFLFLHDPDGARRLPAALAATTAGAPVDRSDEALKSAFGTGLAGLERLWRAFTLEVR